MRRRDVQPPRPGDITAGGAPWGPAPASPSPTRERGQARRCPPPAPAPPHHQPRGAVAEQPRPTGADACPRAALQSPDYQTKKMETKALRNKLFHIKRMVSDYDKVRG